MKKNVQFQIKLILYVILDKEANPVHMTANVSYRATPSVTVLHDSCLTQQVHMTENDSYGVNPNNISTLKDSSSIHQVNMTENKSYGINPNTITALKTSSSSD